MKKTNFKIKNSLTVQELADAVEAIASVFFQEEDDGTIKYTPYLVEYGQVVAVAKFMTTGLEFEDGENIYDTIVTDGDVYEQILDRIKSEKMNDIMKHVYDVVSYRKKINLAQTQNDTNMYLAYKMAELMDKEAEKHQKEIDAINNLNTWIDEQRELNASISKEDYEKFVKGFDANAIINTAIRNYSESELHKKNQELVAAHKQIRDGENKIVELQTAYAKERQKDSVKHVLADTQKKQRKTKTKKLTEKAE